MDMAGWWVVEQKNDIAKLLIYTCIINHHS